MTYVSSLPAFSPLANPPIGSPEYQVEASDFGGSVFDPSFFIISREFPANRPHQDARSAAADRGKYTQPLFGERTEPLSTETRIAQLAALWARIESFTRKPAGWAGEDSVPVSRETAEYARNLLSALPEDLRVPQATMSAEGEIGLIWVKGADCFDVTIEPDGYLSWATKIDDKFYAGEVIELAPEIPFDPLFKALSLFYR